MKYTTPILAILLSPLAAMAAENDKATIENYNVRPVAEVTPLAAYVPQTAPPVYDAPPMQAAQPQRQSNDGDTKPIRLQLLDF